MIKQGYIYFKLDHDIRLQSYHGYKTRNYTLIQQQKAYENALKVLLRQQSKGLISNVKTDIIDNGYKITYNVL